MQALTQQQPLCGSERRNAFVCCDPLIHSYNSRHYLLVCCPSDAATWQRSRKRVVRVKLFSLHYMVTFKISTGGIFILSDKLALKFEGTEHNVLFIQRSQSLLDRGYCLARGSAGRKSKFHSFVTHPDAKGSCGDTSKIDHKSYLTLPPQENIN